MLPDDDSLARYFGLCVVALDDIAQMQRWGFLTMPNNKLVIEHDETLEVVQECVDRGFFYSEEELDRKVWDFIQQWMGVV